MPDSRQLSRTTATQHSHRDAHHAGPFIAVENSAVSGIVRSGLALLMALCVAQAGAACPPYLDHELRALHSRESVNICELKEHRALLLVNTASHCGYTPQFKGLEALHREYASRGLQVVGFASDDFRQEADSEEEAATVCFVNFGVTFPMIAPTAVRGEAANPVFREMARQSRAPTWNFNKYLVSADGEVVAHFDSATTPRSPALRKAIEKLLE